MDFSISYAQTEKIPRIVSLTQNSNVSHFQLDPFKFENFPKYGTPYCSFEKFSITLLKILVTFWTKICSNEKYKIVLSSYAKIFTISKKIL